MTTTNNFFENVVELTSDDILFFDTNILVKLLLEREPYHEAIKHFFVHAINHDCELKTSAIVIKEALYTIARTLYAVDSHTNGTYATFDSAKNSWPNLTKSSKQSKRNLVMHYNNLAKSKLENLLLLLDFEDTTEETTFTALNFSASFNLHSADAFILSNAYLSNAKIVTTDKDFLAVTNIEVFYTNNPSPNTFDPSIYDHVEGHKESLEFLEDALKASL